MLHHLSLGVRDILRAAAFYDAALAPLGYGRVWSDIRPGEPDQAVGYGPPGSGDKLCLKDRGMLAAPPGPGFHVAFAAPSRSAVDAFHQAALAAGGRDNGPPGSAPLRSGLLCGLRDRSRRARYRSRLQRPGLSLYRQAYRSPATDQPGTILSTSRTARAATHSSDSKAGAT